MPLTLGGHPASGALWLKPVNLFGLFILTTVAQVHICSPYRLSNPSPGLRLPGGNVSHDWFPACMQHALAHCPGSSLFIPVDSPGGTGGPLPFLVGTTQTSDFLSQTVTTLNRVPP